MGGAHDFWIEPSTYRPAASSMVTATLRVGEDFTAGEALTRRSDLIQSFVVRDAAGERPVPGFEGRNPAGLVRIDRDGAAVIGYLSRPYAHQISRAKFEQFLREEGIQGAKPKGDGEQREQFSRFAKTALGGSDVPALGWPFELVVEGDVVRALYQQKPLKNAQVAARSRDGRSLVARTDANGAVKFDLGKGV